ncbi:MAG: carbohydrate kinase family protein [Ruminococcaceae bacterium]|nr:carbohydrate kinase family protein [Oscillospiraceae bacterium]
MAGTLVIGFVFVDIKGFAAGNYNPRGRNLGEIRFIHGGVSRNVAENIANTGMPVSFASLTEDSALGNDVVKRLWAHGCDTTYMRTVAQGGIGTWMVILDESGDVAGQISSPPDTAALEQLISEQGNEMIAQCDSIILELDTSECLDEAVLALAKKHGKPVYTVVGNMSIILARPDFVSALDCFVCNEIEAGRMFDLDLTKTSPEQMLALLKERIASVGCRAMVITMGERGAVYYESDTGLGGITPAIPTALVDSTGAGDAFLSGIVMGLSRGLPLSRAVDAGTALASATIQTDESCAAPDMHFWEQFQ